MLLPQVYSQVLLLVLFSITATIANSHSNHQQKEQWEREERRIQRAEIQAEKDKELSINKELTNRLLEIYGNSIANLTALLNYDDADMRLNIKLRS